jgi:putative transposase
MHSQKYLRRLDNVFVRNPIYFITSCTYQRKPILATEEVYQILLEEWKSSSTRHGWCVGRFTVMPDHVHFFARPLEDSSKTLSQWMQAFKEWTSKRINRETSSETGRVWRHGFFDHVLRSGESYSEKWDYVRQNPVRAGLAESPEDWEYSGEIVSLEF